MERVVASPIGIEEISTMANAKNGLQTAIRGIQNDMNLPNIRIEVSPNCDEVSIFADDKGLESIAGAILRLKGRSGPSAHWHFSEALGNVSSGSTPLVVCRVP